MEDAILLSLGGALGAISRYMIGELMDTADYSWGTLVVNSFGSFGLGLLLFGSVSTELILLLGVGFCGAFTTYSSFSVQTVEQWRNGDRQLATLNALGTLVLSTALFGLAWFVVGVLQSL